MIFLKFGLLYVTPEYTKQNIFFNLEILPQKHHIDIIHNNIFVDAYSFTITLQLILGSSNPIFIRYPVEIQYSVQITSDVFHMGL